MELHIDLGALEDCQNIEESIGEICVKCNKCGRFNLERETAPCPTN